MFVNHIWPQLDPSYIPGDELSAIETVKMIIQSAWTEAYTLRFPPLPPVKPVLTSCDILRNKISSLYSAIAGIRYGMSTREQEINRYREHIIEISNLKGEEGGLMMEKYNY
jgi:hypothetical protein